VRKQRHYRGGYQFAGKTELARRLRAAQTPVEELLWEHLRDRKLLGFKFRRQHQFGDYLADFYCREANLVIECDGGVHDRNEQWHHDRNRDAYMFSLGIRVLRVSNDRVLNDTENVLKEIKDFLPLPLGEGRGEGLGKGSL